MEHFTHENLWESITKEPNTGVSIVDVEGKLLYVNEQAVRIYVGDDTRPADLLNRSLDEFLPRDFVEERMGVFRQVAADRNPRLVRSIWRGYQHLAWVYPLEADDESEGEGEGDGEGGPSDDNTDPVASLLILTRRSAEREENIELLRDDSYEFVHAEVSDLGPLKVLSRRELVVLALLGQGLTLKEVAERVHRSLKTVQTQRDAIGRKLNVRNRSELQEIIIRAGLTLRDVEDQPRRGKA